MSKKQDKSKSEPNFKTQPLKSLKEARAVKARVERMLAKLRKKYTHPGRKLIKPTGRPSVSIKKIREAVRKHR